MRIMPHYRVVHRESFVGSPDHDCAQWCDHALTAIMSIHRLCSLLDAGRDKYFRWDICDIWDICPRCDTCNTCRIIHGTIIKYYGSDYSPCLKAGASTDWLPMLCNPTARIFFAALRSRSR